MWGTFRVCFLYVLVRKSASACSQVCNYEDESLRTCAFKHKQVTRTRVYIGESS